MSNYFALYVLDQCVINKMNTKNENKQTNNMAKCFPKKCGFSLREGEGGWRPWLFYRHVTALGTWGRAPTPPSPALHSPILFQYPLPTPFPLTPSPYPLLPLLQPYTSLFLTCTSSHALPHSSFSHLVLSLSYPSCLSITLSSTISTPVHCTQRLQLGGHVNHDHRIQLCSWLCREVWISWPSGYFPHPLSHLRWARTFASYVTGPLNRLLKEV